jgi:hypothetical protein
LSVKLAWLFNSALNKKPLWRVSSDDKPRLLMGFYFTFSFLPHSPKTASRTKWFAGAAYSAGILRRRTLLVPQRMVKLFGIDPVGEDGVCKIGKGRTLWWDINKG